MSETALYEWIDRAKKYTPAAKDKAEPQNLTEQVKVAAEMVQRRQVNRLVENIEAEDATEGVEWVVNNVINGNWTDAATAMVGMSFSEQQEVFLALNNSQNATVLARVMDRVRQNPDKHARTR